MRAATCRLFLSLTLPLIGLSAPALAGGESSGGGADDYRVVPAFFRSWRSSVPVSACYQIADGFGIDAATLERLIRGSFQQWADYLRLKRLNIVPNDVTIRAELALRPACLGDENLVFYFGVENEMIARYRGQFSKPFGFAQLIQDDPQGTGAKGFVWIAPTGAIDPKALIPTWSSATRDALAGLLLHEIGHVFGNGHVDGTVMTEKIGQYLETDTAPAQSSRNVALYSKIDSQIELVPCMECHLAYSAAETFDPIQPPGQDSDWSLTFRTLTGKAPIPPLVIRYERLGSPQGSGKLTLMDATGSFEFQVPVESAIGQRTDSTPLFAGQGGTTFYSFGISYFGKIRTLAGTDIPVAVNYNMDGKKAEILPLGQEFYPRPIFVSAN